MVVGWARIYYISYIIYNTLQTDVTLIHARVCTPYVFCRLTALNAVLLLLLFVGGVGEMCGR